MRFVALVGREVCQAVQFIGRQRPRSVTVIAPLRQARAVREPLYPYRNTAMPAIRRDDRGKIERNWRALRFGGRARAFGGTSATRWPFRKPADSLGHYRASRTCLCNSG